MAEGTKRLAVYTIVDAGDGKKFWRQLGAAFVNRDFMRCRRLC
jgi:hypothetical protein